MVATSKNCLMKKLLILTFIFISISSFGKIHLVSLSAYQSENSVTFNKISLAVRQADEGDTLLIDEGWYDNDFFVISKKLVLIGKQAGKGFRTDKTGNTAESIITFSNCSENLLLINGSGTVIDGITFGNLSGELIGGIYVNADHVIIRNCKIINSLMSGIFLSALAKNSIIENNFLINTGCEAILSNAKDAVILNNYIYKNSEFSAISTSTKAIIRGNQIENPAESGIYLIGNQAVLSVITTNNVVNGTAVSIIYPSENPNEEGLTPETTPVTLEAQSFFDNKTGNNINHQKINLFNNFSSQAAKGISGLLNHDNRSSDPFTSQNLMLRSKDISAPPSLSSLLRIQN